MEARWLWKCVLCATFIAVCYPQADSYAAQPEGSELSWFLDRDTRVVEINQMRRLFSTEQAPPKAEAGWQSVQLPDAWFRDRRLNHPQAWYRTTFDANQRSGEAWSVFVPRISAHAEFWLNGQYIGETSRRTEPLPNMWNYPVHVALPANLLRTESNRLEIFLTVEKSRLGNLYEVYVGPDQELLPLYKKSYFFKVSAAQGLTVIMLLTAAILGYLCFLGSQPASYKWFLVGTLFWALYSVHLYVAYIPFPIRLWHGLYNTAHIASAASFIVAAHRMLLLKRRVVEWLLLALLTSIVFGSMVAREADLASISMISLFGTWLLALYLGLLLVARGRRANPKQGWMVLAGMVVLTMTLWDAVSFGLQYTSLFAKYPYIPVVALVTGGIVFLTRFVRNQQQIGQLELRQKNAAAEAVAAERQRLMREIHDGVGGQLVSTLSLLESEGNTRPDLVNALKTSLSDLRTVINSLETIGQEGNLVSLLAMLRDRMEQFLAPHHIELIWGVQPLPELKNFGPDESLHVMRIVQEAVTNVIKHSDATYVRLACDEKQASDGRQGVVVDITNDGVAAGGPKADEGYGLENLRNRASELCGEFSFSKQGTLGVATIWIPVDGRVKP